MPGLPVQIIAVDGGAASGKSSTSRRVAAALHFLHVDTGAHYRAVTHAALQSGVAPREDDALLAFLRELDFATEIENREALLRLNGNVPADADLRSAEVNAQVSAFAALPPVREAVKAYQRGQADVARNAGFNGIIMDGRDIGTVIFPEADLKIFLTADEATRTARRAGEGQTDAIAARDRMDAKRTTAPLLAADDAIIIDNSKLSLEEVVETVLDLAREA